MWPNSKGIAHLVALTEENLIFCAVHVLEID